MSPATPYSSSRQPLTLSTARVEVLLVLQARFAAGVVSLLRNPPLNPSKFTRVRAVHSGQAASSTHFFALSPYTDPSKILVAMPSEASGELLRRSGPRAAASEVLEAWSRQEQRKRRQRHQCDCEQVLDFVPMDRDSPGYRTLL